jgi:hypothetical protein
MCEVAYQVRHATRLPLLFESGQSFDGQWKSWTRGVEVVIASPIMFFRRQLAGSSSIGWHLRSRSCAVVAPDDRNFAHSLAQFVFLRTRRVGWQLICLYLINKSLVSRKCRYPKHSGQESEVYPDCLGVLPMHLLFNRNGGTKVHALFFAEQTCCTGL